MADQLPSPEVAKLAAKGQIIEAVKLYRRESGAGLAAAKSVVDALSRDNSPQVGRAGRTRQSNTSSRRAGGFLAATVLGFIGVAVTGTGLYRSNATSNWTQVKGEITLSRLVHGNTTSSDKVVVQYEYEVEGQAYRGSRISYTQIWGTDIAEAAKSRYHDGKKVEVHFDPADPGRSVLEKRVPPMYWIVFLGSFVAFFWGASRWISAARKERAA